MQADGEGRAFLTATDFEVAAASLMGGSSPTGLYLRLLASLSALELSVRLPACLAASHRAGALSRAATHRQLALVVAKLERRSVADKPSSTEVGASVASHSFEMVFREYGSFLRAQTTGMMRYSKPMAFRVRAPPA